MEIEVRYYRSPAGREIYQDWLDDLRDLKGKAAVIHRVDRMTRGLWGDNAACREGVRELRIDFGPGYRVYFGMDQGTVVLLLGGGDKSSQQRDIERAVDAWREYRGRR
jgi:putative addiction module killer protein